MEFEIKNTWKHRTLYAMKRTKTIDIIGMDGAFRIPPVDRQCQLYFISQCVNRLSSHYAIHSYKSYSIRSMTKTKKSGGKPSQVRRIHPIDVEQSRGLAPLAWSVAYL